MSTYTLLRMRMNLKVSQHACIHIYICIYIMHMRICICVMYVWFNEFRNDQKDEKTLGTQELKEHFDTLSV
jgi:hypothetical protein